MSRIQHEPELLQASAKGSHMTPLHILEPCLSCSTYQVQMCTNDIWPEAMDAPREGHPGHHQAARTYLLPFNNLQPDLSRHPGCLLSLVGICRWLMQARWHGSTQLALAMQRLL